MLAPNIQEEVLFLPEAIKDYDAIKEWEVRPIAAVALWANQRTMWRKVLEPATIRSM